MDNLNAITNKEKLRTRVRNSGEYTYFNKYSLSNTSDKDSNMANTFHSKIQKFYGIIQIFIILCQIYIIYVDLYEAGANFFQGK